MMKKIHLFVLTAVFTLPFCSKDVAEDNNTTPLTCADVSHTFSDDIQPIMVSKCAIPSCHNAQSAENNIVLETYAQISSEAAKSRFIKSIKHEAGVDAMPRNGSKLSDSTILKIECWINEGRQDN